MQSLHGPIASQITVGAVMGSLKSVSSVGLNLQQGLVLLVLRFYSSPSLPVSGKEKDSRETSEDLNVLLCGIPAL